MREKLLKVQQESKDIRAWKIDRSVKFWGKKERCLDVGNPEGLKS